MRVLRIISKLRAVELLARQSLYAVGVFGVYNN